MFAGPTRPMYYVTHVYNTAPQPQPQTTATPQNNDAEVRLNTTYISSLFLTRYDLDPS